ncbi:MAG: transcriptional regulator [Deltaproteobacteria bacterium]|jgi:DNA-binding NtrC family response regulator|nr:transcriptional regulator [Deltaproteobacteria bacterium]
MPQSVATTRRLHQAYAANRLEDGFWRADWLETIRTESPRMREVYEKVKSVAPTKTTVLLQGDTGVGKGNIAKLIHQHSSRKDGPFVHVHCGTLPDTLVESELFGYEKGAFTGAEKRKLGRFDSAQKGTIFLDEINTVSTAIQIKLLQVLQDHIFQRVGGETSIEADVRVIAAANANLRQLSNEGDFRRDLYYRLSVFPIEIPALADRREDIPHLIQSFIQRFNYVFSKEIQAVDSQVVRALQRYPWPGNIRELENLLERAYILETTSVLRPESFPQEIMTDSGSTAEVVLDASLPLAMVRKQALDHVERQYLKELLTLHQGRLNHAALTAGITYRQLRKMLIKYEIHKEDFKPSSFTHQHKPTKNVN